MLLTVLAILVIVTFVVSGAVKLFGVPFSLAIRDSLDVPPRQWRLIGVLEWLGVVGVAVGLTFRPLGLLATLALAALLVGALITRVSAVRRHQRPDPGGVAMDVGTLVLTVATAVAFALNI